MVWLTLYSYCLIIVFMLGMASALSNIVAWIYPSIAVFPATCVPLESPWITRPFCPLIQCSCTPTVPSDRYILILLSVLFHPLWWESPMTLNQTHAMLVSKSCPIAYNTLHVIVSNVALVIQHFAWFGWTLNLNIIETTLIPLFLLFVYDLRRESTVLSTILVYTSFLCPRFIICTFTWPSILLLCSICQIGD